MRFGIIFIAVLVIACVAVFASKVAISSQDTDFSIVSFKNGKYIAEDKATKEASSISIDKLDYGFSEEDKEITSLKGVISINATVLAEKGIETVTYSTSQPNVTFCFPDEDYSADLNEVILKSRNSITFSESADISYTPIGIVLQVDEKFSYKNGTVTNDEITLGLMNHLDPDFLIVEVTYMDGSSAKKLYSLGAYVENDGKPKMVISESSSS